MHPLLAGERKAGEYVLQARGPARMREGVGVCWGGGVGWGVVETESEAESETERELYVL